MKTVDEIYREMLQTFAGETGIEPDASSEVAVRMYALAMQVYGLLRENEWTRSQCFPQTASGSFLDKHAELRALSRNREACAVGIMRFYSGTTAERDFLVPKGTVCRTAGLVDVVTTEDGTIFAGRAMVEVPAQAVKPGFGGNVPIESVRSMAVAPVGIVSCMNPIAFTGGREDESDAALRLRVMQSYRAMSNSTNKAYYERLALSVRGVEAVRVIPKPRGVGTVDVLVTQSDGLPSDELLYRVQQVLSAQREIAVSVSAVAPTAVSVPVTVKIKPKDGVMLSGLIETVKQNITDWFNGRRLGQSVLRAQLGQLVFSVEGVENYTLSLPAQDAAILPSQLPVLGTLQVEELT